MAWLFLRVAQDANVNFIEESLRPVDDLNMPVRHRIERTRINGNMIHAVLRGGVWIRRPSVGPDTAVRIVNYTRERVKQYPFAYCFRSSILAFPRAVKIEKAVSPTLI